MPPMRSRAFTLLELLVVIAVIAVLTAIISPSLQKSKDSAKSVLCKNNLRQLGQALVTYADTNGSYPQGADPFNLAAPPGKIQTDASKEHQGWWWFHYIAEEHLQNDENEAKGPLWCPDRNVLGTRLKKNILCGNYGINYSISKVYSSSQPTEFKGLPLKPNQIRSASTTMILMDSGYALISWKALQDDAAITPFEVPRRQDSFFLPGYAVNKQRTINEDQQDDALDGRHAGKSVNVLFVDGHVDEKNVSEMDGGWTP